MSYPLEVIQHHCWYILLVEASTNLPHFKGGVCKLHFLMKEVSKILYPLSKLPQPAFKLAWDPGSHLNHVWEQMNLFEFSYLGTILVLKNCERKE